MQKSKEEDLPKEDKLVQLKIRNSDKNNLFSLYTLADGPWNWSLKSANICWLNSNFIAFTLK